MATDFELLINQQNKYLIDYLEKKKLRYALRLFSSDYRKIRKDYYSREKSENLESEFESLYLLTNRIDKNVWLRRLNKYNNMLKDLRFRKINKIAKKVIAASPSGNIAIACIIKNEARYIEEWIAYHISIGVDHFYIFDNGSTDDSRAVIEKYISSGMVTIIDYPGTLAQLPAYRLVSRKLKGKYRWVAYIDADEFLLPKTGMLPDVLKEYDDFNALAVNWTTFGPSGHKFRPEGLIMENYVETFEDLDNPMNLRVKVIANPDAIYDFTSPHFCILRNQEYAKDEDRNDVDTKWMYVCNSGPAFVGKYCSDKLKINHYWTKSEEDILEKCQRGYASGGFNPDFENIKSRVAFPMRCDYEIQKYLNQVKQIIQSKHER